jgi:hypothetical protein
MSEIYKKLNRALTTSGVPASVVRDVKGFDLETEGPVNVLVNTGVDAAPFAGILLSYGRELTEAREIEMVARCMNQPRGFVEGVPWLLSLVEGYPGNALSQSNLWAVGYSIYTINCKQFYPEVISICHDEKYGRGRQMLMGSLSRARTDDAYDVLVDCLHDPSVRGHVIEALGRFGRVDAISILEALPVQKGHFEFKAKKSAIRRLRRKLASTG